MEVVILTKKYPQEEVKVGNFGCWKRKSFKIPIKTAIFRLKISHEEGLGVI